jgi:hypothetical protein
VTRAWEAITAVEAACVDAILVAEISAKVATATRCSAVIHIKDAKDRAVLLEREAWERVLRVEVDNNAMLASAHEDE